MTNPWEVSQEEDLDIKLEMLPKGKYLVQVVNAEERRKDGAYLAASTKLRVIDGEHEGRVVTDFLIVERFDNKDCRISRARFRDLCVAADVRPSSPEELIDSVVVAEIEPGDDGWHDVTGYKKSDADSFDTSEPTAW